MVAWLITWEWIGDHAKVDNKIAAILNYRTSAKKVKEFVEQLYVDSCYSLSERIDYAKNKKNNPYPAEFDRIDGIPWGGRIICGHHPFLCARMVDDLKVVIEDGEEKLVWKERKTPDLSWVKR